MHVNILGTRGVPASHGGFETFAEHLAIFLRCKGHSVTVYCQEESCELGAWEDEWRGIGRIHIAPRLRGPRGTMEFDLACIRHVRTRPGVDLVLGYNTAVFCSLLKFSNRRLVMNMDGIEWKRTKWSIPARVWFFFNEIFGANVCDVAIADHPEIARHIQARCLKRPVVIPYGSEAVRSAPETLLRQFGVEPDRYLISIARIEPENSILELVRAFSSLETDRRLVILGRLDSDSSYHDAVRRAAGPSVLFPGAVYDAPIVLALRFHARAYLHGHQVGGTNPSLVEALGAGNAVIAHDNRFNRWVAGPGQRYFGSEAEARTAMRDLLSSDEACEQARLAARAQHDRHFHWEPILRSYEQVLMKEAAHLPALLA